MQLAFWDFPPTECLELAARALSIEAERQTVSGCVELLHQQQVDVALLPVLPMDWTSYLAGRYLMGVSICADAGTSGFTAGGNTRMYF